MRFLKNYQLVFFTILIILIIVLIYLRNNILLEQILPNIPGSRFERKDALDLNELHDMLIYYFELYGPNPALTTGNFEIILKKVWGSTRTALELEEEIIRLIVIEKLKSSTLQQRNTL